MTVIDLLVCFMRDYSLTISTGGDLIYKGSVNHFIDLYKNGYFIGDREIDDFSFNGNLMISII